jgi:N utilization substance protein A
MNTELFNALDMLEKERGISKEHMIEKIKAALLSAYKKEKGGMDNVNIVINEAKKDIKVYQQKTIVEVVENPETEITFEDAQKLSRKYVLGGTADVELKTKNFGRISAQAAKQVIIQGIREA